MLKCFHYNINTETEIKAISTTLGAQLATPQVVRGFAEAVPTAQVLDRHAGVSIAQESDDLFFGKSLLHVQSPG
jgi:hypothetical protein